MHRIITALPAAAYFMGSIIRSRTKNRHPMDAGFIVRFCAYFVQLSTHSMKLSEAFPVRSAWV